MMKPEERAAAAAAALRKLYPGAECSLHHGGDPFQLLVMARLSAQCTDERVNIVSVELFRRFPTAADMAAADLADIESLIRSCGLYHTKAQSIKECAAILVRDYGGRVPDTMEALLALPGVGRKIANLVLGDVWGKGGIVADTHCIRICGRLGFYDKTKKDPLLTERVMTPLIPPEEQSAFCHRIVLFGREWCTARAPRCAECPLRSVCAEGRDDA